MRIMLSSEYIKVQNMFQSLDDLAGRRFKSLQFYSA